jgi:P-type conjugative transfer protein TrbJ
MRTAVRRLLGVLVFGIAATAGASAQTYGIPATTGGIVGTPRPIPAIACPPNPFNGGGWSACNSFAQWVTLYNEGVRLQNELSEIRRNTLRYATYPQKTQGYVRADLARLETIVDRTNGLAIGDRSIEATIGRIFPDYASNVQYTDLTKQLAQATARSVLNALKVAGLEIGDNARDAATADVVKDAVARATSPTQATQALAQLTAVMIEQLQKQQRIEASSLNAAAAYYLSQSKSEAARAYADAAAIKAWQQFSTVTLPTLTPAQAKAIVGNP